MCLAKSRRLWRRSGVQGLVGGHIEPSEVGTPQGGPLSPLLANILLLPNSTKSWKSGATASRATQTTSVFWSKVNVPVNG